jgi:ATP-dependent exoDNAse (exonuclease V) alpha subunit
MKQSEALAILKTGANVFLTGEPGSGKTFVVSKYIEYLNKHGIEVAVTASTGIAATHLNGMTIHSWSGIGIRKELSESDLKALKDKDRLVYRAKNTKVLVIDEISMLDATVLNVVDKTLKTLRENEAPFGGMQVVFVGDFFQLPPVVKERDQLKFAFESVAWKEAKPVVCYLSEQYRQEDSELTEILKTVRGGGNLLECYTKLWGRKKEVSADDPLTRLYSHNIDVDLINGERLKTLEGDEVSFQMLTQGRKGIVEQLKKGCLAPETLVLKKGARVMFVKNNYEAGYVNGTLGEVVDFKNELPIVATTNGEWIEVELEEWAIEEDGRKLAVIAQIPLRLAWAITVHKSQGMTLEAAVIDLSNAFEYGQGYVAISRVRTLSGLFLLGLNERALEVHPEIIKADINFKIQSQKATKYLEKYTEDEMNEKQLKFMVANGGKVKKKKKEKVKGATYEITLALFKSGKSIAEMAQERNYTEGTIISHLEKLRAKGEVTQAELIRMIPDDLMEVIPIICEVFNEFGDGRLGPVYNKLNGAYSYEELKLVRLVM